MPGEGRHTGSAESPEAHLGGTEPAWPLATLRLGLKEAWPATPLVLAPDPVWSRDPRVRARGRRGTARPSGAAGGHLQTLPFSRLCSVSSSQRPRPSPWAPFLSFLFLLAMTPPA